MSEYARTNRVVKITPSQSLVGGVDDDLAGLDLWCGLTWVKTLKRAVLGASAVLTKPEPVFVFLFKNHTSLAARASAGGAGICLPRAAVHYRPVEMYAAPSSYPPTSTSVNVTPTPAAPKHLRQPSTWLDRRLDCSATCLHLGDSNIPPSPRLSLCRQFGRTQPQRCMVAEVSVWARPNSASRCQCYCPFGAISPIIILDNPPPLSSDVTGVQRYAQPHPPHSTPALVLHLTR
ncbi:hypothetical protein B0H13DRAFT_2314330 [Mycena leptocephala]|nr:hypothetical protein B0H13DRAFT_2314330 [Mycena leptocephala]